MDAKENYIKLVLAFLAGALLCYAVLCFRESGEIRQIRQQYGAAVAECARLSGELEQCQKRLETVQGAVDAGRAGIGKAEGRIDQVAGGMRSDEAIIRECQQLINELRKEHEGKNE